MANGSWKIARGKTSPQFSIAVMAFLAAILVLLGRVQSSLFDRARTYFSDTTAPALEVLRQPMNGVSHWVDGVGTVFAVYQENQRLRRENAELRQWQNAALVLQQRLKRYQLLLNAVPDPSLAAVTAHVIGRTNHPFFDTMILDTGHDRDIKPGEAVVDARGMIGRIYLVGQHTAWVILLTDPSSRIPVSIEPGHVPAILSGDNSGAPALEVSQQGVTLQADQQIVTSGDGGLLPAGLAIGSVVWDGGVFRAGLLASAATADDVRILDLKNPPEQAPVPGARDLPVSAAGLPPLAPPVSASPATQAANRQPAPLPGTLIAPPATAAAAPAQQPNDEQDH
jgi:rod shape-determining protein MreC